MGQGAVKRRLSALLLGAAMLLPLSANAASAPLAPAPSMRDMAACCNKMHGACPMAPSERGCCLQCICAPQPPALLASEAPMPPPARISVRPGTPITLKPLAVHCPSADPVQHPPPRLTSVLLI